MGLKKLIVKLAVRLLAPKLARALAGIGGADAEKTALNNYSALE